MKKLGILGCGYLGNIVAEAYRLGLLEGYELVGAVSRTMESTRAVAEKTGCKACETLDELLELKPDYIAEASSVKVVKEVGEKILRNGTNLVLLSIGALADAEFRASMVKAAQETGTKMHIPSGAIGGFDVLQTLTVMSMAGLGEEKAGIHNITGPEAFYHSPFFRARLTTETEDCCLFEGSAKEAIELLPHRVNVAVATSLATAGPEHTTSKVTSRPGVVGDIQHIIAEIPGMKADINIYSKTSSIAGWSVVALLRNLESPVMFQ